MMVHTDRYSTTAVPTRKAGVVVHTSESGDASYPSLVAAFARPGDRLIAGTDRYYGSSYHAITRNDLDATYDELLPASAAPFAAPPLNRTWWHLVIPGRAGQTRGEWLDSPSRSGVLAAAKFIVAKAAIDGFPLRFVGAVELVAGAGGYTSHAQVSAAWRQSDHWDPGPAFPWDVLAADIAALTAPIDEEDDMKVRLWRHPDYHNVFATDGGGWIALSPQLAKSYLDEGAPMVVEAHDQTLKSALDGSGLSTSDLVRT